MKWLPIETAPKDGTIVLLYRPSAIKWMRVAPGSYDDERVHSAPRPKWDCLYKIASVRDMREHQPTHWMPLPEPPTEVE